MYWANFLHIYQPPTQKAFWINKIARESYSKLCDGLLKNPRARVTLNINAVLTEHLVEHGWDNVVSAIRTLAKRGQVEFTETAKYHPFLPLIPESEIVRQIELNHYTNRKHFGSVYNPRGFFPTEMGFNEKIATVASKLGFSWIIVAELAFPKGVPRNDTIYYHKNHKNLLVFFRNGEVSFRLLSAEVGVSLESPGMLESILGKDLERKDRYLITAVDGETFGHHRPGLENLLFELYRLEKLTSITLSELASLFPKREAVLPRPSTWALLKKDIHRRTPYSRWKSPSNKIHALQWQLTNLALQLIRAHPQPTPRLHLDRALHSDQYWWASAQPWWSIEMIEAGAKDLLTAVESFRRIPQKTKERARKLYRDILFTAFDWQRTDKITALARAADEDVTQRITRELPYIPKKEFVKIVANLRDQMWRSSRAQEFERAAQLRNRIQELEDKKTVLTKKR